MFISSFTRFTAFTASPNEPPGARLKDRVTTGNCPWWLTVMGALVISRCVKVLSGTWPLLLNVVEDCGATPNRRLKALVELGVLDAGDAPASEDEEPLCGP